MVLLRQHVSKEFLLSKVRRMFLLCRILLVKSRFKLVMRKNMIICKILCYASFNGLRRGSMKKECAANICIHPFYFSFVFI